VLTVSESLAYESRARSELGGECAAWLAFGAREAVPLAA
jgi:hypothetical protein